VLSPINYIPITCIYLRTSKQLVVRKDASFHKCTAKCFVGGWLFWDWLVGIVIMVTDQIKQHKPYLPVVTKPYLPAPWPFKTGRGRVWMHRGCLLHRICSEMGKTMVQAIRSKHSWICTMLGSFPGPRGEHIFEKRTQNENLITIFAFHCPQRVFVANQL